MINVCSYAECRYAECHYAECQYAECQYAACHYAKYSYTECRYAECHFLVNCDIHANLKILVLNEMKQNKILLKLNVKC
jgi:hypothetical protein